MGAIVKGPFSAYLIANTIVINNSLKIEFPSHREAKEIFETIKGNIEAGEKILYYKEGKILITLYLSAERAYNWVYTTEGAIFFPTKEEAEAYIEDLYEKATSGKLEKEFSVGGGGGTADWIIENRDPTPEDVPNKIPALWVNLSTGEIFVCTHTCGGKAIWVGQRNTEVFPTTEPILDVFKDGSCIALYRFEGNANDESGNYHGIWVGNEQYDDGVWGKAAKFDGGSYIKSDVCSALDDEVSLSMHFYLDTTSGFLFNLGGMTIEAQVSNGNLQVAYGSGWTWITVATVSTKKWYHLVATYKKSTGEFKLYLDKQLVHSGTRATSYDWGTFCLGYRLDNASATKLRGRIDQVRVFNRVITQEEVGKLTEEKYEC